MDKKLFELNIGTPTGNDLIAFGVSGTTYKNMKVFDFRTWVISEIPDPEYLTKVVSIGSFDMRNGASKDVYLGMSTSKVRTIEITIRSNEGGMYPISYPHSNWELSAAWLIRPTPTYNAKLHIHTNNNRFFDRSNFSGSANRGFITVTYRND